MLINRIYTTEVEKLSISVYRQNANKIIQFSMIKAKDIDKIIGKNLKRLRLKSGLTQDKLGEMIKVDGVVIAQIEGTIRGMGKEIQARLCNALNIRPDEFYINKETPVVRDKDEQKVIIIYREAKELGNMVAEKIPEYGKFIIKETKKPQTSSSQKSKTLKHKEG